MPRQRGVIEGAPVIQQGYWRASDGREVLRLWRRSGASLAELGWENGLCCQRLARRGESLEVKPAAPGLHPVRLVGTGIGYTWRGSRVRELGAWRWKPRS